MRRKSKRQRTAVAYADLLKDGSEGESSSELSKADKDSENDYAEDHSDEDISVDADDESIKEGSPVRKLARTSENFVKTSKQAVIAKPRFSSSLKERFKLFYGQFGPYYVKAVRERINWGSDPFYVKKELMKDVAETENESVKQIDCSAQRLQPLQDRQKYYSEKSSIDILFSRDVEHRKTLKSLESTPVPGLNALVFNVGGIISSISWAPGHTTETKQFLAVSVINQKNWDPINLNVLSDQTSSFVRNGEFSTVFVFDMNITKLSDEKIPVPCYSYSTDYGNISSIAWRPRRAATNNLIGHLAIVCGDGALRLIEVQGNTKGHMQFKIETVAKKYSLNAKITAICWRSKDRILVGTSEGELAEFDITDEDDGSIPSFYHSVSSSLITSIACASPEAPDVVAVASTDGFIRVFDIKDLRRSRTSAPRTKHFAPCIEYSSQLNSFVGLEDNCTTKIVPIRRMHTTLAGTGISRHSGSVTTISTSRFHPFILSGGADGSIKMGNSIRRIMVNSKKGNELYKSVKLWQLTVSTKEQVFSIDEKAEIETIPAHQESDNQYVFPAAVTITNVSWNPNFSCGNVYACSTASGILRIEKL